MLCDRRVGHASRPRGLRLLLGDLLLTAPPGEGEERHRAAEVWRLRERTEHEAASLFAQLSRDLRDADAPEALVALARRSAADERDHARRCRAIIELLRPSLPPLAPDPEVCVGDLARPPTERALYGAVAIGCVTESLSTALLLAMRAAAGPPLVRDTIHAILKDEVRHSRLGWATLACFAEEGRPVGWIAAEVPKMLRAALPELEVEGSACEAEGLPAYGVLGRAKIREICEATIDTTILPGLARFGVEVSNELLFDLESC